MTYSLDGIISNAVVRSGGAGRSGLHMILQIGYYSKNIDTVITLPLLPQRGYMLARLETIYGTVLLHHSATTS